MIEWRNQWMNKWMNDWLNENDRIGSWNRGINNRNMNDELNEWRLQWINKWMVNWVSDELDECSNKWMNE